MVIFNSYVSHNQRVWLKNDIFHRFSIDFPWDMVNKLWFPWDFPSIHRWFRGRRFPRRRFLRGLRAATAGPLVSRRWSFLGLLKGRSWNGKSMEIYAMEINGNRWKIYGKSMEIYGKSMENYGKSMENLWNIFGNLWKIYGNLWKSMENLWTIYGHLWKIYGTSLEIYGNLWNIYGTSMENLWKSMEIYGNLWKSMEIYGTSIENWKSMEIYGKSMENQLISWDLDIFHGSAIFITGFFNRIWSFSPHCWEKYKGYDRSFKRGGLVAQQDEDSTHADLSSIIQPCLLSQRGRGKVITWSHLWRHLVPCLWEAKI